MRHLNTRKVFIDNKEGILRFIYGDIDQFASLGGKKRRKIQLCDLRTTTDIAYRYNTIIDLRREDKAQESAYQLSSARNPVGQPETNENWVFGKVVPRT
jgi:hypothetical protein